MTLDDGLTPQARKLLNVLRGSGEWLSRAELARTIDRAGLTAHDRKLLQYMLDKGIITSRQRATKTGVFAFEYKAKRWNETESRGTWRPALPCRRPMG